MQVVVPYSPVDPNTRLEPVLTRSERRAFARVMLGDVLAAIEAAVGTPTILSPEPLDGVSAPVSVDARPLSAAVNAILQPPMAVIMADLPLLTPTTVERALAESGPVVIGPGRGGGTNLLVVRDDGFSVDFHGNSLADHRRLATEAGLPFAEIDSYRVSTDIDEPPDLVEVLLHGEGEAPEWLRANGFELRITAGRVALHRQ